MPTKHTYAEHGDACATAHALELVGDHWNYPVLRELMLAPKRFNELLPAVRGITTTVLSTRLRYLQGAGLIVKVRLAPPAGVTVYQLTDWARQLDPILQELGRWAQSSPIRDQDGGLTPDSAIQSMRTMAPPHPLDPPVELMLHLFDARVPGDMGYDYLVSWGAAGFEACRGTTTDADTRVEADSSTWARVLYAASPLDSESVRIHGRRDVVERLVSQFAPASN